MVPVPSREEENTIADIAVSPNLGDEAAKESRR
jgi:hypothetical protein